MPYDFNNLYNLFPKSFNFFLNFFDISFSQIFITFSPYNKTTHAGAFIQCDIRMLTDKSTEKSLCYYTDTQILNKRKKNYQHFVVFFFCYSSLLSQIPQSMFWHTYTYLVEDGFPYSCSRFLFFNRKYISFRSFLNKALVVYREMLIRAFPVAIKNS